MQPLSFDRAVDYYDETRDLPPQVAELVGNTAAQRLPALADATRLPLRSAAFDAVVGVHVLHLIADWRVALDEVRRVLKPGGVLLIGYNGYPYNLSPQIDDVGTLCASTSSYSNFHSSAP